MQFSVWAPHAKTIELEIDNQRWPMSLDLAGWWSAEADAEAGSDYAFHVNGDGPFADPRSAWQPYADGPSRVLDHKSFHWNDAHWQSRPLSSSILYELHIPTFTPEGTFDSAIHRLDDLAALGITHVELMPVAEAPGSHGWGYDGVNLFAPHHAWGGPDALKRLVDACHVRGLGVILDVVYNHLGPQGNYLPKFGPYFTERYHTPWGWAINLDQPHCEEVRRYLCDNAAMWLRDYHFDGLRLDAVHALIDNSSFHFLEQLSVEVEELGAELGRHLFVVAESDLNNPRLVHSREMGGYGMDAQWSDDFHHALHTVLTGERNGYYADFGSYAQLAHALRHAYVYDGCYSQCRLRRHGRSTAGLSGHRFLGYIQTHDQIGNRAQGNRISHLVSPGRAKIAAALVLTSPFVPMLFQGEEWGASSPFQYFTNFEDEELGAAVREGRRHEFAGFGWGPSDVPDPQDSATFERSKLNWDERTAKPHADLLDWHRRLIELRRRERSLLDGRMENVNVRFDERAQWFIVERGSLTIACNFADEKQQVPFSAQRPHEVLLASAAGVRIEGGAVWLPAESVTILDAKKPAELSLSSSRRRRGALRQRTASSRA